jgi:hypothetical protein
MAKDVGLIVEDKEAPKVVGGTGRQWAILLVGDLPLVPGDQEKVLAEATLAARRFPEASFSEGIDGLKEVAARGKSHPGELGDLVPPTERAGAAAQVLERSRAVITRLEALTAYHRAVLAIEEHNANILIDDFEEEADRRIQKARIPPEAYDNLRRYVAARGEAVSRGRAQAKAVQEARAASKNDPAKPDGGSDRNG